MKKYESRMKDGHLLSSSLLNVVMVERTGHGNNTCVWLQVCNRQVDHYAPLS